MRRQQKSAEQPHELTQVRLKAGMTPGANHRTWAKTFLNDNEVLAKLGLPPPDNERWPKREPQYEAIRQKFPAFTWRAEVRKDKFDRERRFVVHHGAPTVRGILPTLADLLLMDPSLADSTTVSAAHAAPVGVHTTIGGHSMFVSNETEGIPTDVVQCLEQALNAHAAQKTTSCIVRLDMAPMHMPCTIGELPIYEVETSPGISLALRLNPSIREPLVDMIDGAVLPPKYASWAAAYEIFTDLGVPLYTSWSAVPTEAKRVYVSCEGAQAPDEFRERLVTDPWGKKDIDFPISGGRLLWNFESVKDLIDDFPQGFVIKPIDGWGAEDVCVYAPDDKAHSHTLSRVERTIHGLSNAPTHVVQPFYKPRLDQRFGTVIWRVFAVRRSPTSTFKLIGGMWNGRTSESLIVHGARDAVFGPLAV